MLVSTLLTNVRSRIADVNKVGYGDLELIDYLNSAQIAVAKKLAKAGNHQFIKTVSVTNGDAAPSRFLGFLGDYSIRFENGLMYSTPSVIQTVRYIQAPELVTKLDDVISFDDIHIPALINSVCQFALNRNEFDIQQDAALGATVDVSGAS